MCWYKVRLELAITPEFPRGSTGRAFLLRLPLGRDGSIDAEAIELDRSRATVRRFWASEPDRFGYIVRMDGEWRFRFSLFGDISWFQLRCSSLAVEQTVVIDGANHGPLPFRVVSIDPMAASNAITAS